jgi:predicted CXXCH cytochrome family protein
MRRIVMAVIAAVVPLLIVSGLAFADGGPHGGYTATTDACAGCHRTHTAAAPKLLIKTEADLCLSCHGLGASGADTNVLDGIFDNPPTNAPGESVPGRSLKGGGFTNVTMTSDFTSTLSSRAATSMHAYDGSSGMAWGNGAIGPTAGVSVTLSCAGCHNPHGNGSYRILRKIPLGSGATEAITVTDTITKIYTISDNNGMYFLEGFDASNPSKKQHIRDEYGSEMSDWCGQCHTRYMAPRNSATTPITDTIGVTTTFTYRHSTYGAGPYPDGCLKCHSETGSPWPVQPGFTYGDMFQHDTYCMTCHVAHGTSAEAIGFAASQPLPGLDGKVLSGNERSSLLRVDNRGTCQACHEKSPLAP